MSLDKVLRLSQPAALASDTSDLVRLASARLEQLAVLLAKDADGDDDEDEDPDDDGDDDTNAKGDTDNDYWGKNGKQKKPLPGKRRGKSPAAKKADKQQVETCQALVLETMVALSQLSGGETLNLSVLTQAQREKPSAHTISGSTDYPIPDKAHLAAAVARYKQGKFAGHSQQEVAAHIRSRAKALGETVDLTGPTPGQQVLALAKASQLVAMDHAPITGEHDHPHRVSQVHSHRHTHNGDNRHACGDAGYGGY